LPIGQKLSFSVLNANRLEILLQVQQGMAFHIWTVTFVVSAKILHFLGVKDCPKLSFLVLYANRLDFVYCYGQYNN